MMSQSGQHADEKIALLKENIKDINKEIQNKNEELKKANLELNKIKKERLNFLKNLLKEGYYRDDGVKWILA